MKSIMTSTLPVMIFGGSVLLIYYLYARLWIIWAIRKIRKKQSHKYLTNRLAIWSSRRNMDLSRRHTLYSLLLPSFD